MANEQNTTLQTTDFGSTDIEKIDKVMTSEIIKNAAEQLNMVLATCNAQELAKLDMFTQTVTLAVGMTQMREIMTEQLVRKVFLPLMGSPLGFVTDKDKKPKPEQYTWMEVRECVMQGMIAGLRPVNNEMNIIAGRAYGAKNGFQRLVETFPGISDLRWQNTVPQDAPRSTALVGMRATWKLNGIANSLVCDVETIDGKTTDTRLCVKVNEGQGPDAIIGKAERKMFYRIYRLLTNGAVNIGEGPDIIDVEPDGSGRMQGQQTEASKSVLQRAQAHVASQQPKSSEQKPPAEPAPAEPAKVEQKAPETPPASPPKSSPSIVEQARQRSQQRHTDRKSEPPAAPSGSFSDAEDFPRE